MLLEYDVNMSKCTLQLMVLQNGFKWRFVTSGGLSIDLAKK